MGQIPGLSKSALVIGQPSKPLHLPETMFAPAEDVDIPGVVLPRGFNPEPMPIPGPIDPNGAGMVEGEGLPSAPPGAGPVPGLSWRWSGQPPSAAELAQERGDWLANHQGVSDNVREYGAPRRMHEMEVEDAVRQARNPAEAAMLRGRLNQEWEAGPEGQRYARDRADLAADEDLFSRGLPRAKMQGKIGLEDALVGLRAAMSPEGRQARAMQFEEGIAHETDPRVQAIEERKQGYAERIAGLRALQSAYGSQMGLPMMGLDPLSRLLGMTGDAGAAPAGGAAPMRGGPAGGPAPAAAGPKMANQRDVEAYAHANNILFDQAVRELAGYGYRVQMSDGSVR